MFANPDSSLGTQALWPRFKDKRKNLRKPFNPLRLPLLGPAKVTGSCASLPLTQLLSLWEMQNEFPGLPTFQEKLEICIFTQTLFYI